MLFVLKRMDCISFIANLCSDLEECTVKFEPLFKLKKELLKIETPDQWRMLRDELLKIEDKAKYKLSTLLISHGIHMKRRA